MCCVLATIALVGVSAGGLERLVSKCKRSLAFAVFVPFGLSWLCSVSDFFRAGPLCVEIACYAQNWRELEPKYLVRVNFQPGISRSGSRSEIADFPKFSVSIDPDQEDMSYMT